MIQVHCCRGAAAEIAKACWLVASRYVDRAAALFSTWAHLAWRVNDAVGLSGSPDLERDGGGSAEDRCSSSLAANCRAASAASALAARAARTFRRTKCFPDRSFFLGFPCRQTSLQTGRRGGMQRVSDQTSRESTGLQGCV